MKSKKDHTISQQAKELEALCLKNGISFNGLSNLVKNERDKKLMRKRVPLQKMIEEVITKESEL